MKFFIEKNKNEGHRVTINIPKVIFNNAIFRELIKISKKTNMNGFRKGKIPIKVMQEKYGQKIYYDVFQELMQKFFYEFIQKEKIKIIGSPKYYMHQNQDEKEEFLMYSVDYEIYPKLNIKDIKITTVDKIVVKITENDIKEKIEEHYTEKNLWNTFDGPIKTDNRVTIDYNIYENNKRLNKFDLKNIIFSVYENKFLSILNDKIINHFINDIVFFTIPFHKYYPEKELRNKNITFKIKIIRIEKKIALELNEKTKKQSEKEILNSIDYKKIQDNVKNQINKITEKYLEEQIIEEIIRKNPISIPPILLKEEIKFLYEQKKQEYQKNNNLLEKKYHLNLDLQAKKRLYRKIVLEKIISDNKLSENEEKIQKIIEKISLNYEKPIQIINLYNNNKNLKNAMKNIELQKQAINWLKKNIQIKRKKWNLSEFIKYKWPNNEELFI